jgi:G3E family GTPase
VNHNNNQPHQQPASIENHKNTNQLLEDDGKKAGRRPFPPTENKMNHFSAAAILQLLLLPAAISLLLCCHHRTVVVVSAFTTPVVVLAPSCYYDSSSLSSNVPLRRRWRRGRLVHPRSICRTEDGQQQRLVVLHSTAATTANLPTDDDDEVDRMNNNDEVDDRRVPVTILTGFLGSGKTTLLNHLLQQQQHNNMTLAIIENEFGEVGVDEHLLYDGHKIKVDQEPIIEVINGCICCTVRGDLIVALDRLYNRVRDFDGVIIETTGLADPAPVCQTFFLDERTRDRYRLDAVITVVDSQYILDRLVEMKPHGVVNEAVAQVAFADKILLNKIDLVKGDNGVLDRIETKLKSINPTTTIQRTVNSVVAPADILHQRAFEMERVLEFDPDFLRDDDDDDDNNDDTVDDHGHQHQHHDHHQHDGTVSSVGIKLPGSVNYLMLERWLDRLVTVDGANLYRYKGLVSVQGVPNKYLFQGVGMTLTSGFANLPWRTDEPRESRFCFIGKNLDRELYVSGFTACRVDAKLRFAVGDDVEVNIGTYVRGTVLKQWDDGNAYRVEIEDEFGYIDNVWAPIDIDNYIRRPILKR